MLPFTRQFIRDQLLTSPKDETKLCRLQTDRWIQYVGGYSNAPQHIERQLPRIYYYFDWCVSNQEWDRVVRLGENLSEALFREEGHTEQSHHRKLIEICQRTADAAQKLGADNAGTAVDQWCLLARLYSNTDNPQSRRLALEYAKKALDYLEDAREESTLDNKWADTACMVADLSLLNEEIAQAEYWLEKVRRNGLEERESWPFIAYQVAISCLSNERARYWLNKVADVAYTQGNYEIAVKAKVDLAHLDLRKGHLDQAMSLIEQAREISADTSPTRQVLMQLVRATTIEAQVAYHLENPERCQSLLEEAIDSAKSVKLQPVVDRLYRWWSFISLQSTSFDPAGETDKLLGARLMWGVLDAGLMCAICNQEFVPEDLFEDRAWFRLD